MFVDLVKLEHVVLQDVTVKEHDKVLDHLWNLNLLVLLRGFWKRGKMLAERGYVNMLERCVPDVRSVGGSRMLL
jgi:hypothetical protein